MDKERNLYSFLVTERPRPPLIPGRVRIADQHLVRLRGMFMQVVVYRGRKDPPQNVATPLIIGRRLARIERRAPGRRDWIWVVALVLRAARRRIGSLRVSGAGLDHDEGAGRTSA